MSFQEPSFIKGISLFCPRGLQTYGWSGVTFILPLATDARGSLLNVRTMGDYINRIACLSDMNVRMPCIRIHLPQFRDEDLSERHFAKDATSG
jgi:hypothetical protein